MSTPIELPKAMTFDDPGEDRLYRKQHLAAAFRLFSKFGFDSGSRTPSGTTRRSTGADGMTW